MEEQEIGIISTDWHLDTDNQDKVKRIIQHKINYAKEKNIKHIFGLGDFFEDRKAQPLVNLKGFEDILNLFQENKLKLIGIPGNHDKVSYLSEDSYLDQFKYHPGFKLIKEPTGIDLTPNLTMVLIPYFLETDTENGYLKYLNQSLEYLKNKGQRKYFLGTHIGINGFLNNKKISSDKGLNQESFKIFDKLFIGHFHDRNKHYIGSLMPKNFGEDNNKGFITFTESGKIKYIDSYFPSFITHKINLSEHFNYENVLTQIKKDKFNKNYVRVELIGTKSEIEGFDTKDLKEVGVKIEEKRKEIEDGILQVSQGNFISFDEKIIMEEFEIFVKEKGLNKEKIKYGREKLINKLKIK